jgi:sugar phosphate isomerase/epimerase
MKEAVNRRGFLKAALTAAGGVGISPSLFAAQTSRSKPWKMRLSTSSIHFKELPIENACQRIANLGFEAIDIWSAHQDCPHLDDVLGRLGPEGLKAVLAENKLKLFAFSVYKGGYAKYAELLGKLGGGVAVQGSIKAAEPKELTSQMKKFIESLKPLADLAEENNSFLAIENHGGALLNTLDSLKAFVDINRSPRLGIALAPFHIQSQEASVEEAIRICGKQLLFFYAWQKQQADAQLPGIGATDMTSWLEALAEIRYKGYVNPFTHSHPGAEIMTANLIRSRQYLMDCYKRIEK